MIAKGITPILNVSDITDSIAWFEKLGWSKAWVYADGDAPSFAAVCSGEVQIFLCRDGQGGRGRGGGIGGDGEGVWMSIWVEDVDAIHQHCVAQGLEVTMPPTDEPWKTREMHLRHPDGHIFRISKGIEE